MTLLSHYVITYNHKTGKFEMDDGTAESVFSNGTIYDMDSGVWIPDSMRTSRSHDEDMKGYYALLEMLKESNRKRAQKINMVGESDDE